MRWLILITVVSFAGLQQPPEPQPGNPEHKEPPAGWFCQHAHLKHDVVIGYKDAP